MSQDSNVFEIRREGNEQHHVVFADWLQTGEQLQSVAWSADPGTGISLDDTGSINQADRTLEHQDGSVTTYPPGTVASVLVTVDDDAEFVAHKVDVVATKTGGAIDTRRIYVVVVEEYADEALR